MVTGESAEATETKGGLKWTDKPLLVFVCDEGGGCETFDKIESIVLKDEKVALGMKAFRTVKMAPELLEDEPMMADTGKTLPRMVFLDPVKNKRTVLEAKKVKASSLYKAMKKVAASFYKENLDKVVKTHLKILTEQDKISNESRTLTDKKQRLAEKKDKAKLKKIEAELAELKEQKSELAKKKQELWNLTPKAA